MWDPTNFFNTINSMNLASPDNQSKIIANQLAREQLKWFPQTQQSALDYQKAQTNQANETANSLLPAQADQIRAQIKYLYPNQAINAQSNALMNLAKVKYMQSLGVVPNNVNLDALSQNIANQSNPQSIGQNNGLPLPQSPNTLAKINANMATIQDDPQPPNAAAALKGQQIQQQIASQPMPIGKQIAGADFAGLHNYANYLSRMSIEGTPGERTAQIEAAKQIPIKQNILQMNEQMLSQIEQARKELDQIGVTSTIPFVRSQLSPTFNQHFKNLQTILPSLMAGMNHMQGIPARAWTNAEMSNEMKLVGDPKSMTKESMYDALDRIEDMVLNSKANTQAYLDSLNTDPSGKSFKPIPMNMVTFQNFKFPELKDKEEFNAWFAKQSPKIKRLAVRYMNLNPGEK